MNSDELNKRIRELESLYPVLPFEAFGGKAIPHIGWYWRTVNFDRDDTPLFGVIPPGAESPRPLVGFMENNKWDYPVIVPSEEEWANIKALLIKAVSSLQPDDLEAANNAIQALADTHYW